MAWMAIAQAGQQATEKAIAGVQAWQTAKTNAKIANSNADQVWLDAVETARRQREMAQRLGGAARAGAAAQGIEYDGSYLEASADQQGQVELEALDSLWQGKQQADRYRFQAKVSKAEGKAALGGAILGAGGKALGGLEKFYAARKIEQSRQGGLTNGFVGSTYGGELG